LDGRGQISGLFRNFQYSLTIYDQSSQAFVLDFGSFNDSEAPLQRSYMTGDFSSFAALLTNGVNNLILIPTPPTNFTIVPTNGGGIEHRWFADGNEAAIPLDLQGFTVTDIVFALDSWTFTTHPADAVYPQAWFESALQARVLFQGYAVPEPSRFMLGLIGILGILSRRSRK
jgi:hypothetical protein